MLAAVLVLGALVCGLCWWLLRSSNAHVSRPEVTASAQNGAAPEGPPDTSETPLESTGTRTEAGRVGAPVGNPASTTESGAILVHVRGTDGQPFAGAWTLEIEDADLLARHSAESRRVLEQNGPSASIVARAGFVHALCARSAGLASGTVRCDLGKKPSTAEVEVVLAPAGEVFGRVVDERAQGVADLGVWVVPKLSAPSAPVPGAQPNDARPLTSTPLPVSTRTDASGGFRTPPLQPGAWHVLVGDRDSPIARKNEVTVTPGSETWVDEIALPRMFSIVVRVKDDLGAPVPNATVTSKGTEGGTIDGVTNASGEVVCDKLPAGRYRVFVSSAHSTRANFFVEIPGQRPGAPVDLVLRSRK